MFRITGNDLDDTARSIEAEQSTLRPLQNFYAFDIIEFEEVSEWRWLIDTIDIDCHRVLTAWITIGCSDSTDIRGRIIGLPVDDQPWHCELQRGGSCHSCRCGLCTCDRADRYRHILQSLLATLRCDADISDRSIIARSVRSEEHTSELQSLMRNSYAVF